MYTPYDARSERAAYEPEKEVSIDTMAVVETVVPEPQVNGAAVDSPEVVVSERLCRKCNTLKPAREFYSAGRSSSGVQIVRHTCKACDLLLQQKRYGKPKADDRVTVVEAEPNVIVPPRVTFTKEETDEIVSFWRDRMPVGEIASAFRTSVPKVYGLLKKYIPVEYTTRRIAEYISNHGGNPVVGYVLSQQLSLNSKLINESLNSEWGKASIYSYHEAADRNKPWAKAQWVGLRENARENFEAGDVPLDVVTSKTVAAYMAETEESTMANTLKERQEEKEMVSRSQEIEDRLYAQPKAVAASNGNTKGTTEQLRAEAIRRYQAGGPDGNTKDIQKSLGIGTGTLYRWLNSAGVGRRRTQRTYSLPPEPGSVHPEFKDEAPAVGVAIPVAVLPDEAVKIARAEVGKVFDKPYLLPAWRIKARVTGEVEFTIRAESMQEAIAITEAHKIDMSVETTAWTSMQLVGVALEA
jgi:hypothetical protein